VLILLGTGCSSVFLKGTPFYTGDRERPTGDAEKRVNLWPVAYYRDPDLSIIWPLTSFTDDHVAVRPFASVYKLDEEKHQVNVLAPLMQFDYDTDDYRVFPVFWGDDYFVTFPLVWWYDDTKGIFPVFWWDDGFTAFPLVWYEKDEFCHFFPFWLYAQEGTDGHDLHVLWPIGRHRKNDEETGFDVWPLLGSYSGEDEHRRYALWPLLQDRREDDEHIRTAAPLWFQYEDEDDAWWCLAPAAFRWKDKDGDGLTITPLWSSGTNDGTDWSLLFPLYYASANEKEDEQTVITLLGGRRRSEGHTAYYALPLLSSYAWGEGEKEFWFLGPLGHARWDADNAQHHVFPFYYYDSAEKMLLTPLASVKRQPDDKFTNLGIILAHYGERDERKTFNFLWPIFQTNWGADQSSFDIFPLMSWKWWDSDSEMIRGEEKRKHHTRHTGRSFWMFPWINTSQTNWVVTPDGADKPSERIETGRSGAFPLWSYRRTVTQGMAHRRPIVKAKADSEAVTSSDQVHTKTDFSLLLWLYDYRRRSVEAEGAVADERVRSRILWRVMHYERRDGDAVLDVFPAITWDSQADGDRQFSFLWRFFRWGRPAQGGTNLDLLFIPILRAKETPEPEGT
jgi:hypothetical protein